MFTFIASLALSATVVQGISKEQGDLQVTTFELPQGQITVYLPDDMIAGDTISGTVVPNPKGTGRAAELNGTTLMGYVITVQGEKPKRNTGLPVWTIPAGAAAVVLAVTTPGGASVATANVPITGPGLLDNPAKFSCDPVNMASGPLSVPGPFDGDSGNTKVSIGNQPATVVAESPRSAVAIGPNSPAGPTTITVNEAGQSASLPCNLLTLEMTVPKQTLLEGERTNLTLKVSGLSGLPDSAYPIPCELTNESPQILRMDSPSVTAMPRGQALAFGIEPNMVRGGVMTMNVGLVGIRPGQFLLRGVLFNVKIHDIKKKMNVATFNTWVNGLIAGYKARIAALKAEEAAEPSAGRRLAIARKEKILGVLESFKNATNNDLDVSKIAVDKVLADDAFFAMASELITTAAEMLGYTEIPMPGIGQIVKGMKALAGAAKLAKTLAALEAAEKLTEAYEKLTDAAEKAEMVGKIKDALDKVKEALDADE